MLWTPLHQFQLVRNSMYPMFDSQYPVMKGFKLQINLDGRLFFRVEVGTLCAFIGVVDSQYFMVLPNICVRKAWRQVLVCSSIHKAFFGQALPRYGITITASCELLNGTAPFRHATFPITSLKKIKSAYCDLHAYYSPPFSWLKATQLRISRLVHTNSKLGPINPSSFT